MFCHISPTPHLNLVSGCDNHLVLAHLVEEDPEYREFYRNQSENGSMIILDNSAFEMFKRGLPMYDPNKLLEQARLVGADYIAMSDYPGEHSSKTIKAAQLLAPQFHSEGFGTFFVPQSQVGDIGDYIDCVQWAVDNSDLVDYIGFSILGIPNAYGVEKNNKLQRFSARLKMFYELEALGMFQKIRHTQQRVHMLGLVDGPNEILFMKHFAYIINTWDSSSAIWAGLNGRSYDNSPTGLVDGKFEKEVDFAFKTSYDGFIELAKHNMDIIDYLWVQYYGRGEV